MGKKPISATLDEQLIKWIELTIKSSKKFRNKSHLIESAIEQFKESEND